ncbi:MAG: PEP-CTERM sorting domain-containing protein [Thiobacillus sp.]|nr:PEP-CTERM sorting domain-containing protein [Thiobacillus sp.]
MKLKMIALAAMLAAGSANAGIVDGSTGNGELFMTVLDNAGQKSYTLDLNLTMNDFLSGIAVTGTKYSYAADANMTSFLSGVAGADRSSLIFAIGAMDNIGATTTDTYRYISSASVIDLGTRLTNLNLKQLGTNGDQFLGDTNGSIGSANSLIVTDPSAVAYAGSALWGSNWGNKANFTSTGLIGGDLGMYYLTQTSGTFGDRLKPSSYAALMNGGNQVFANLDMNGNLMVAAVPEAETYAMMLAGLGLVGFMVARRRKAI